MPNDIVYIAKKGPADPFRGDWYIDAGEFTSRDEAVAFAAKLTLEDHSQYATAWAEFGYEWSVFEKRNGNEKKIWEGYKYISCMNDKTKDTELGFL